MSKPRRRGIIRCLAYGLWSGRYRFTMHGPVEGEWVSADEPFARLALERWGYFRCMGFQ